MFSSKNKELNPSGYYGCIDLRILRRDAFHRQPWLWILIRSLKNGYRRFQQTHWPFYPLSAKDRRVNYFIWAASLIIFMISLVQSILS